MDAELMMIFNKVTNSLVAEQMMVEQTCFKATWH